MSDQFDAVCETHSAVNGRQYLAFTVEAPGDHPAEFELQPSPLEDERLKEYSVDATDQDVGWVPAVYDDSWAVAWDPLDGYPR